MSGLKQLSVLVCCLLWGMNVVYAQKSMDTIPANDLSDSAYVDECTSIIEQLKQDHKEKHESLKEDMQIISLSSQRYKLFSALIVFFILIFVSLILYNAFKSKNESLEMVQEKTDLIAEQEEQLKKRNYDLEQGVFYARRIQEAVLPLEEDIRQEFEDAFVLFEPKNVVSGDFYWYTHRSGDKILSVLDCTGHGIAGGYMALMGNDLLNQIVQDPSVTDPAQALTYMNLKLVKSFAKINDTEHLIDGMEVAICAINELEMKMEYAGAYRHLYLVRDGELEVITGDNYNIGTDKGLRKQFTLQEREIKKGDVIYLHTDGYANQFGGPSGKKFKYKQLQALLEEIYDRPMSEQRKLLLQAHKDWKGNMDQLDDICIVGVRI